MKKLIMAVAIAVSAIVANAATINWAATKGYLYNGLGTSSSKLTSGSAYLMFVTNSYTQDKLVDAFYAANGDVATTLAAMGASGAMATGAGTISEEAKIAGASTSDLAGADGTVYFVVFNDDKMYVSGTTSSEYNSVMGTSDATFASMSVASKVTFDDGAAYSTAGWYSVPEPTSGMLLLVGCALMALKRKRA